ncbi:calcium-binding protein [Sphingomonas sp. IC4-52]|uniref:calcium-binding protein n=1 Tax=Sphingomonas sp. IC4-52 TaxID=2887202 RepID=UPI001D1173EC|nr:calcium-binding protein [Sphingomonas sp. IC4-52]MCC2981048.1 M10 family metallopeptidase C-terminal domain-containing protein [Sphingomonas sp. IC4-52]
MADGVQAAPQVLSLTFDYDNRYSPTVRMGGWIELVLAERLAAGQNVRVTFGDVTLDLTSIDTQRAGERVLQVMLPNGFSTAVPLVVSDDGRHIGIGASSLVLGLLNEISAVATGSEEAAPVITTTPVDMMSSDDFSFSQGRVENFAILDSRGRSEMLLDDRTTQLAIIDFGALWCGPTQRFQQTLSAVQQRIGNGFDMKSVLFEAARGVYATTAEAAVQEHAYRLRGDIFTVSADDERQAIIRKDLGLAWFSPQLVVDQVTGEILGQISSGQDLPGYLYADQVVDSVNNIIAYVETLADTPGITRGGTRGSDVIAGSVRADRLSGGAGRDYIDGGYGDDELVGGDDNDVLIGAAGNDTLRGGSGNDRLVGGSGFNTLIGGDGDGDVADYQQIDGGIYVRLSDGGRGVVSVDGEARDRLVGIEQVWGGVHDDVLIGSTRGDTLYGGNGNDLIRTGGAAEGMIDIVAGDNGDDVIVFEGGRAEADGGWGADVFVIKGGMIRIQDLDTDVDTLDFSQLRYGVHTSEYAPGLAAFGSAEPREGLDSVFGLITGFDRVLGTRFADFMLADFDGTILFGGAGNDQLLGGAGDDELYGEQGNDFILGGAGDDILLGHAGRDEINGGDGDDLIAGGAGADILTGGAGYDFFVWDADHLSGRDTITDFTRGEDVIDLSNVGSFSFLGRKGFTGGGEAEVRFRSIDNDTLIQVDVDGNSTVDLTILLNGHHMLGASDFILAPSDLPS